VQRAQRALVEARANLACEAQRRRSILASRDEQRAERRARAAGVREADNDELFAP
jgi:hypothetical protein